MIGSTNVIKIGGNQAKDLSMYNIYGQSIARTTANCYVINTPGTYKIPLVFGNAIKDGSVNAAAYTNNGGEYSRDFVDYNGTVISSPYIENVSGQAASIQLSISDADRIISNISIVNGSPCRFVQFTVTYIPSTGGNGVISIKDSNGTIMWSWHIWLWEDDLTPVEITNATGVTYRILPYNLASTWDEGSKMHIKNWYYQFGRPTPLIGPSAYNSTTNATNYGVLEYTIKNTASNIQEGIQNPAAFYRHSTSYYNWYVHSLGINPYNLWDAACTTAGCSDNNVVKTVYDPSPIGFKIPNGNTFTGFSTISNANGIVQMSRYSGDTMGISFPLSGYRNNAGVINHSGSYSYVYLSASYSFKNIYIMYFGSSSVSVPYTGGIRGGGNSVRCVEE